MTRPADAAEDLSTARIIKAPRSALWNAWADPVKFARWWIPEPMVLKVDALDLRPGGAFVTRMSEDGETFTPHMNACFLVAEEGARIVFTTTLIGGWRPAPPSFMDMTAVITFADHPDGTAYSALAMHKDRADRDRHEALGFHDGWGTVTAQLARLVE